MLVWSKILKYMRYLFFVIILTIVSCKKDQYDPSLHWGTVSGEKNGIHWEAQLYAGVNKPYEQGIDILIEKYNSNGYKREELYIFKIPSKIQKKSLTDTDVRSIDTLASALYGTLQDDGDVGGDSYYLILNDTIEDYIEITQINGDEIKGKFQMSFYKDLRYGEADPSTPDTIVFKNGQFHTRIVD